MRQYDQSNEKRIAERYDLAAAILSTEREGGSGCDAAFERDVDADLKKRGFGNMDRGGCVTIPDCVLRRAFDTTSGSALIPTYTQNTVPAIYHGGALAKAGANFLTTKSHVIMPTMPTLAPGWISAEGGDATELSGTVGAVNLTPKTVAGYAKVTHKLMTQSPDGVTALTAEIVRSIRAAIEKAVFAGTGTNGQPSGLDTLTGTTALSITAGNPTRAEVNAAWRAIAEKVEDPDRLRWIMDANAAWTFRDTLDTNGDKRYLLHGGNLADTPVITSGAATVGKVYLADWSKLTVCNFGGIDLRVIKHDAIRGEYTIVCFADVDFAFTRPATFGVGTALTVTEG